jgi:hypothetical protein
MNKGMKRQLSEAAKNPNLKKIHEERHEPRALAIAGG